MCLWTCTDPCMAKSTYIFGHFKPLPSSWVLDAASCFIGRVASHIYPHVSKFYVRMTVHLWLLNKGETNYMQQLVILLVINCSSTCFGCLYTHHQEVRLRFTACGFLSCCSCCDVGESGGKMCKLWGGSCSPASLQLQQDRKPQAVKRSLTSWWLA